MLDASASMFVMSLKWWGGWKDKSCIMTVRISLLLSLLSQLRFEWHPSVNKCCEYVGWWNHGINAQSFFQPSFCKIKLPATAPCHPIPHFYLYVLVGVSHIWVVPPGIHHSWLPQSWAPCAEICSILCWLVQRILITLFSHGQPGAGTGMLTHYRVTHRNSESIVAVQ